MKDSGLMMKEVEESARRNGWKKGKDLVTKLIGFQNFEISFKFPRLLFVQSILIQDRSQFGRRSNFILRVKLGLILKN
jgi:hypothetical protein